MNDRFMIGDDKVVSYGVVSFRFHEKVSVVMGNKHARIDQIHHLLFRMLAKSIRIKLSNRMRIQGSRDDSIYSPPLLRETNPQTPFLLDMDKLPHSSMAV